jgi:hypothetical protein
MQQIGTNIEIVLNDIFSNVMSFKKKGLKINESWLELPKTDSFLIN